MAPAPVVAHAVADVVALIVWLCRGDSGTRWYHCELTSDDDEQRDSFLDEEETAAATTVQRRGTMWYRFKLP